VAEVARREGILSEAVADRHHTAFARVGLPTTWSGATFDELHDTMLVDKKSRGSQLRLVVLDDLARPRILPGPSTDVLRAAYDAMTGADR
nr:3-dehydroquinate synthase [Nocardioides sp.]